MARKPGSREPATSSPKESRAVARAPEQARSQSDQCPGSLFADDARPPASDTPHGRGRVSLRQGESGTADPPAGERGERLTPLEVLLGAMHAHWRSRRYEKAVRVARDAAPYVHPRLARVAHQGEITVRHEDALGELD